MLGSWFGSWLDSRKRSSVRRRRPNIGQARWRHRPLVQALEDRTLLSVTLVKGIDGINSDYGIQTQVEPPDTSAAAGPSYVVENVNSQISVFSKSTGQEVFTQPLETFFTPADPNAPFLSDTWVSYDEQAKRFFVSTLDIDFNNSKSYFDFAVSNDANPLDGWTEMQKVETTGIVPGGTEATLSDYPRIGWNKDAYVITFNMFGFNSQSYTNVEVLTIQKASMLDKNPGTLVYNETFLDGTNFANFTLQPATMHDDTTGGTMWLVEQGPQQTDGSYHQLNVVKMTDYFNPSGPTFSGTLVNVDPYLPVFNPPQDPLFYITFSIDSRVFSADFRNNTLVVAQNVNVASDSNCHARWTEFDLSSGTPRLLQDGTLSLGTGIDTFYPSVALAPDGTIGMTYMQSSTQQNMSMYVTGHNPSDPPGVMQPGKEARAGDDVYWGFRAGDYSEAMWDTTSNTFWGANEYARPAPDFFPHWGTWIEQFKIKPKPYFQIQVPTSATAGTAFTFTVVVTHADGTPYPDYTGRVHFTSSDPQAVLPRDYTFTATDAGTHTFQVRLRTAGLQSVTITDVDDASTATASPGILVSAAAASKFLITSAGNLPPGNPFSVNVQAGVPFIITVTAVDPFGNVQSSYTGTVHFTSSDPNAVLPPNFTFVAANQGVAVFQVTLYRQYQQSITATDTANSTDRGSISINVVGGQETAFVLSLPGTAQAGVPLNLTVSAVDQYGNVLANFDDGVTFTSSDPRAALPYTYFFTPADHGRHVFVGGVTFGTFGTQTVIGTEVNNPFGDPPPPAPITGKATVKVSGVSPSSPGGGTGISPSVAGSTELPLTQMWSPLIPPMSSGSSSSPTGGLAPMMSSPGSGTSTGGSAGAPTGTTPQTGGGTGDGTSGEGTGTSIITIAHLASLGTWGFVDPVAGADGDAAFAAYLRGLLNGTIWTSANDPKLQ